MNRAGKFLGGLLMGGLFGSLAALLMAPDSGQNFRQKIRSYVENVEQRVAIAREQKQRDLEEELEWLRAPKRNQP